MGEDCWASTQKRNGKAVRPTTGPLDSVLVSLSKQSYFCSDTAFRSTKSAVPSGFSDREHSFDILKSYGVATENPCKGENMKR